MSSSSCRPHRHPGHPVQFQVRTFLDNRYVVHLQEDGYNYLLHNLQSDNNSAWAGCSPPTATWTCGPRRGQTTSSTSVAAPLVTAAAWSPWTGQPSSVEQGRPGGPAGQHRAREGQASPAHHHLLLWLLQHRAAAQHCGGLSQQHAACC